MITKIYFYYFRYLNGFLLRIITFMIFEILKNKNFNFIDDDYKMINEASESITNFSNPYEDSDFRKGPILPFLFLLNNFSEYNFMKVILIMIDLINSILIEILLNLQNRKFYIKRKITVKRKENECNNKFVFIKKIFYYFKINISNIFQNHEITNKTHNEMNNNKSLTYFSHLKFDILNSINNKEKNFNYLLTNEIKSSQNNDIAEESVEQIRNGLFKGLFRIIRSILDNKYSYSSMFYLYNPIIIFSVAKGNYDTLFFMLIFLILISIELDIYALAGALYGISIHFEYIPLLYLPGIILYIFYKSQLKETFSNDQNQENDFFNNKIVARFSNFLFMKILLIIKTLISELIEIFYFIFGTFFSLRPIKFIFSAVLIYCALFLLFYLFFGDYYLNDMFFYHIFLKNERLNFSIFNYSSLFFKNVKLKKLFILSVYLVQITLVLFTNLFFYKDINLCLLISTWTYVIFRKEVFIKNISWIFILLSLNIHSIKNLQENKKKYIINSIFYCLILLLWGYNFYQTEINGINRFFSTWFINLIFFIVNCCLINEICSNRSNLIYYID